MADPLSSYRNSIFTPITLKMAKPMQNLLTQFTINGQGKGFQNFALAAGVDRITAIQAGGADPFRGMYAKQNVGAEVLQAAGVGASQIQSGVDYFLKMAGMNSNMVSQFNQTMTPLGYQPLPHVNKPGYYSPTPWGRRSFYTGYGNPNPIWF